MSMAATAHARKQKTGHRTAGAARAIQPAHSSTSAPSEIKTKRADACAASNTNRPTGDHHGSGSVGGAEADAPSALPPEVPFDDDCASIHAGKRARNAASASRRNAGASASRGSIDAAAEAKSAPDDDEFLIDSADGADEKSTGKKEGGCMLQLQHNAAGREGDKTQTQLKNSQLSCDCRPK